MHSMGAQKRLQAVEAKIQRHNYIEEYFPELTVLSLKNLWFTCIYQGQLSQRERNREETKQSMKYLQDVLDEYPCKLNDCTAKEKIWLSLASVSLSSVCKFRNALKIGL